MKAFLGQYAKVIITGIVIVGILAYLLSSGSNSFSAKMPEAKATYNKEDSSATTSDIAKRKPPEIIIQQTTLSNGDKVNVKMKWKSSYKFSDSYFVDYKNEDGTKTNVTLKVKEVIQPNGAKMANPESQFQAMRGIYEVTYYAEEIYRTSVKHTEISTKFLAD